MSCFLKASVFQSKGKKKKRNVEKIEYNKIKKEMLKPHSKIVKLRQCYAFTESEKEAERYIQCLQRLRSKWIMCAVY